MSASPRPVIEFWYEFASTYSYPAAMTVEDRLAREGITLRWRPFLLGPVFRDIHGQADSPFNTIPVRGRYMWRDLTRICHEHGLALRRPLIFPVNALLAARIAHLGERQPWIGSFTRAVYLANFAYERDISDAATLRAILEDIGLDADDILTRAGAQANKDSLKARTQAAVDLGIFGAPNFVVTGGARPELFWGFDRLEAAIAWAKSPPEL